MIAKNVFLHIITGSRFVFVFSVDLKAVEANFEKGSLFFAAKFNRNIEFLPFITNISFDCGFKKGHTHNKFMNITLFTLFCNIVSGMQQCHT